MRPDSTARVATGLTALVADTTAVAAAAVAAAAVVAAAEAMAVTPVVAVTAALAAAAAEAAAAWTKKQPREPFSPRAELAGVLSSLGPYSPNPFQNKCQPVRAFKEKHLASHVPRRPADDLEFYNYYRLLGS